MRTAYGPPNGQIVFFEELKATLMESLLLGLDLIVLSESGNGRGPMDFCGNDFKRNKGNILAKIMSKLVWVGACVCTCYKSCQIFILFPIQLLYACMHVIHNK